MLEIIALLCLPAGLILLYALSVIDLKVGLLPNELVLGFAICGSVFHLCTLFDYMSPENMALGAFIGGGILYFIREVATRLYGEDALGLGDVKLLAAAGIWLGPYYILIALSAGAMAGVLHGLAVFGVSWFKTKTVTNLNSLSIPAGPGFAAGIIIAIILAFGENIIKMATALLS